MGKRIRRGRGESAGTVPLFVEVAPHVKALVDRWSEESGDPKWAVVERVFNHVAEIEKVFTHDADAEEQGVALPSWWPATGSEQEELPLSQTA